ncbi:MAG TPA: ribosome biogenesis GTPase YlqF [Clostridia bacterium]|nr:ribosome biogenesis GTPase YlqF [Clostridia bacterium]
MNINWYPGHMAKAKRLIAENLKMVDMILEIRDARIPISSANPDFEDLFINKTRIIFLNKSDLADPRVTRDWIEWFAKKDIKAVSLNSLDPRDITPAKNIILHTAQEFHNEVLERRGIKKTIRGMVIGIPNVGKSAFINGISGLRKAKTGNRPGVTKIKQWIAVNPYVDLLDTPGLLWPKLDQREVSLNLAYTRTIKEEILDIEEVVHHFLEKARDNFPDAITSRYGQLNMDLKGYEIMEDICLQRGWVKTGGIGDTSRGARHILDDFQQGRLGKISIELPSGA